MEKTVKDLSDNEIVEELNFVEERIADEYKILSTYKSRRKEIIEEMKKRLKEREEK